MNKKRLRSY